MIAAMLVPTRKGFGEEKVVPRTFGSHGGEIEHGHLVASRRSADPGTAHAKTRAARSILLGEIGPKIERPTRQQSMNRPSVAPNVTR